MRRRLPSLGDMLDISGLTKRYGDVAALDDVSFSVSPGRMTGFVGANGAGKTTTMRIMLGIARPDTGEVHWHDRPITAAERVRIGYLPEERGLYPKMRLLEQLVFFGRLHGLSRGTASRRARALLDRFGLTDRAGDRLEALSLGNAQRVQIAAALLFDPELLILDEPFSGLDPVAVETMGAVLRERATAGVPVLFSSHQLDLVERLCDDLVVIDAGRVVAAGEADELRRGAGQGRYRVELAADAGWLRELPEVRVLDVEGPRALVKLASERPDADQRLLDALLARGAVRAFAPDVPSLAEVYREVTR